MFYIISIFWLLSVSGFLTLTLNKKVESLLPIVFLLSVLILYLFGFLNNIKYGYYCTWIFVFAFWIIIVLLIIKKDKNRINDFVKNYFTIGLLVFVLLVIYSFVLCKYKGFSNCDEFSHWGPMLKETLRLNGFYCQDYSKLIMHKDYPPFYTLLQFLWCCFSNFEYHEGISYIAMVVFMFSLFMPLFSKIEIKRFSDILKPIFITISIIAVGLTIDITSTMSDSAYVYNSIYVDWSLALYFAYMFYYISKSDFNTKSNIMLSSLILSCVLLMKQISIVFYLLSLSFIFIKTIILNKNRSGFFVFQVLICAVFVPMVVFLLWKGLINRYGVVGQFSIDNINIKSFFDVIKGKSSIAWKNETYFNFLNAIKNRVVVTHPFKMTYFEYVVFICILLAAVCIVAKKNSVHVFLYLVGSILYVLVLLVLYTLVFSIDEAPYLASFNRYVLTYLYFGTTLSLMMFIDTFNDSMIAQLLGTIVLLSFVEPKTIDTVIPKLSINESYSKNVKVFIIEQYSDGTHFEREDVNGLVLEFIEPGYLGDWQDDYKTFCRNINDSDGIYIVGYDDTIYKFWKNFNIEAEIANSTYYSINREENQLSIVSNSFSYIHYVIMYYAL